MVSAKRIGTAWSKRPSHPVWLKPAMQQGQKIQEPVLSLPLLDGLTQYNICIYIYMCVCVSPLSLRALAFSLSTQIPAVVAQCTEAGGGCIVRQTSTNQDTALPW